MIINSLNYDFLFSIFFRCLDISIFKILVIVFNKMVVKSVKVIVVLVCWEEESLVVFVKWCWVIVEMEGKYVINMFKGIIFCICKILE